jgi:hypothetical protein
MSLPTSVYLAPHTVRFVYVSDPVDVNRDPVFGEYLPEKLQIALDKDAGPTRMAEIIVHETLHALNDASPFLDPDSEEGVVTALAPALVRLMQDNPNFFPQLQALANQR